jgi:hypothetical protein
METRDEHGEQVALIDWCSLHIKQAPELELIFAIPSGGHRHKKTAGKLKAEGVKAGVPDLFLPVARLGFHGLWIEMKVKGGRIRPVQFWWLEQLVEQGYMHQVCWSFEEARDLLMAYLGYEWDPNEEYTQKLRKIPADQP